MIATASESDCSRCFGLDVDFTHLPSRADAQAFVANSLHRFRPDWTALAPHLKFDRDRYARNLLYRDEHVEVLLLCWLPGQKTPVHDHGASWGVSAALNGDLFETSYRVVRDGAPLQLVESRLMHPGAVSFESGDTVHEVGNASSSPIVSLHIYGPPLARFTAYDPMSGERRVIGPALASAP